MGSIEVGNEDIGLSDERKGAIANPYHWNYYTDRFLLRGRIMYDAKELCEKIIKLYPDIGTCGKQCVSLGLEIAQLKNNIEGEQF